MRYMLLIYLNPTAWDPATADEMHAELEALVARMKAER